MKKIRRGICYFLYKHIAFYLPRNKFGFYMRKILVRGFLLKAGKDIKIEKYAKISTAVEIGERSGIGYKAEIYGHVIIGNDVMMGPECLIHTVNHEYSSVDKPMRIQGYGAVKTVIIGNDVWIGQRAIILPGSVIGDGSIIGAGAVIRGNIEEFSVMIGNPAVAIKNRKGKN